MNINITLVICSQTKKNNILKISPQTDKIIKNDWIINWFIVVISIILQYLWVRYKISVWFCSFWS